MDFSNGVDVMAKVKSGGEIKGEYRNFMYLQNSINSQLLIYDASGGISGTEGAKTEPQAGNIYFILTNYEKQGDYYIKLTGQTRKPNHCHFGTPGQEVEVKFRFDDQTTRDRFYKELQTKQGGGRRNKKRDKTRKHLRKSKKRKSKRRSKKSKTRRRSR